MPITWHSWLDIALLGLTLVTVPVYVVFLVALVRQRNHGKRQLASAFFTLSFSVGIADLYHFFNSWLGMRRLPLLLPVYLFCGDGLAKFFIIGSWMVRASQGLGVLMITVNRFTMIWWPYQAKILWNKKRTLLYCLLTQWGVSACYGGVMLCFDFNWKVDNTTGQASPVFTDDTVKRDMFIVAFAMEAVICPAVIVFYALALYSIIVNVRKMNSRKTAAVSDAKHQVSSVNQSQPTVKRSQVAEAIQRSVERNLTCCGLIICSQEVIWVMFLLYATSLKMATADFFALYSLMGDVYASSNPWVLLVMSQPVRDAFRRTLGVSPRDGATIATTKLQSGVDDNTRAGNRPRTTQATNAANATKMQLFSRRKVRPAVEASRKQQENNTQPETIQ